MRAGDFVQVLKLFQDNPSYLYQTSLEKHQCRELALCVVYRYGTYTCTRVPWLSISRLDYSVARLAFARAHMPRRLPIA